ncbi:GNAT family N-acetyltransferase [Pradoshia sp.]
MAIAKNQDIELAVKFMERAGMEVSQEEIESGKFILLKDDEHSIKGMIGIEACGEFGLLRSFLFVPEAHSQVPALFEAMLAIAREQGVEQVFLVSNKQQAMAFFEALQFIPCLREELPEKVKDSPVVEKVCTMKDIYFMSRHLSVLKA